MKSILYAASLGLMLVGAGCAPKAQDTVASDAVEQVALPPEIPATEPADEEGMRVVASTPEFNVRANGSCQGTFTLGGGKGVNQGEWGMAYPLSYAMSGRAAQQISNVTVQTQAQYDAVPADELPTRPVVAFRTADMIIGEWRQQNDGIIVEEIEAGGPARVMEEGCDYEIVK